MEVSEGKDWDVRGGIETRFPAGQAGAEECSQRSAGLASRRGLRLAKRKWRIDTNAYCRTACEERSFLQPVPHDGPVFTDARGNADRAKPSLSGNWRHSGNGYRVSGVLRDHSQGLCDVRRTAEAGRLYLRLVW